MFAGAITGGAFALSGVPLGGGSMLLIKNIVYANYRAKSILMNCLNVLPVS